MARAQAVGRGDMLGGMRGGVRGDVHAAAAGHGDADAAGVPAGARWYVVQSQARKELYASANLENQGFPTFTPRLRRTVRHARRLKTVLAALFPGYLFVLLDLSRDRWRSVGGTFGVSRMVMAGGLPAPVPQGLVESLAAAADGQGAVAISATLTPGEPVRLLSGPFADRIGRLAALDEAGRARVLLEILGAEREVRVAPSALVPAAGPAGR